MTDVMHERADAAPGEPADDLVRKLAAAQLTIDSLERALLSARTIGAAIGILMARESLTYAAAFDRLVTASKAQNRKLREIADDVVLCGTLLDRPL